MSNTPQHPPSDAPIPPPSGSFTPAGYPPQPVYTPPGGTQQGYAPAAHPPQPVPSGSLPPPQPVPPASPPPRSSFAPSRNPFVRLILWFTEPSMIKGMAVGVILALVVGVALKLQAIWYIASGLFTILFVCLFGVLIGHYVFESRRKKVQAKGMEMLRQAGTELPGLSDNLMTLLWSRDRAYLPNLWERISRIRPAVEEILGLTIAVMFRTMAMSALFAVLGAAISFAVFLTSFMQVERMTEQNKLIQLQLEQTDKQMKFAAKAQDVAVALSVGDRRQVMLRDLINDVDTARDTPCGADVPLSRFGEKKRCLPDITARQISTFVALLQPYKPVVAGADGSQNDVAETARSPEQQQFLRYLSANNIEVGSEALDLSTAFLDHADLHATFLERIRLTRVSMRGAKLYDADFTSAELAGADLTLAVASRAKLNQANLATAKLHKINLSGADLTDANLVDAVLTGANLKGAVLQQAQLGNAVFHGANLADVNLGGADLTGADLALANLGSATMPQVPKVRAAAFWWLGIYAPDYAAKLGLGAEAQQRNQAAFDRLTATTDPEAAAAIVQELKNAAPTAPA